MDTNDQPGEQMTRTLTAAEEMWRSVHAEFGLYTAQELAQRLGTPEPDEVRALYAAGALVAVHRGGRVLYPGFQIDQASQAVRPVVRELLRVAEGAGRSEASLILWLVSPGGSLDGARPVDHLEAPDRVLQAAKAFFMQ